MVLTGRDGKIRGKIVNGNDILTEMDGASTWAILRAATKSRVGAALS